MSILCLLALFAPSFGRVTFLNWGADNGNVPVTCGANTPPYPIGNYFAQTCNPPGQCPAPVTYSWLPELSPYGITLNTAGAPSIIINPTAQAVALGSLSTTISAGDTDGLPATATLNFTFNCPLRFISNIPSRQATEGTLFSLNASAYIFNPMHPLTWTVEGLPSFSALSINSQGILSGVPSFTEVRQQQPLKLTVTATDTTTGLTVRSNAFDLTVGPKAGIAFPSALGIIPPQSAVENVLFQLPVARYFNNPSNFGVVWTINGGPLRIDSTSGVISVTPGEAELLATRNQPLQVTVTGSDERGNIATSNTFTFAVQPQKLSARPVPNPLPSILCGALCCPFNISDFVFNPSANPLQVTSSVGLPSGSAIRVSPDGTLTGVASLADVRASPITLLVNVNNGDITPVPLQPMIFSVTAVPAPTLSTLEFLNRTVKVGSFFQLDAAPYFVLPPGAQSPTWTISAPSSSLSIDFTGKVSGTITEQDFNLGSTMSFTVSVGNRNQCGGGTASKTFSFTIDPNWSGPNCAVIGVPPNIAVCESTFLTRAFSQYCQDPKGLALNYSMTGLPNSSGLILDGRGVLTGALTPAAAANGFAMVSVCATNIRGLRDCTQQFQIAFQRPKRPPIVDPPIPSPVTAIKGQRFVGYFNFHFFEPDFQPLIYSVAGLPVGSGMGIGPITGIFSGTPNEADFRASPLVLSVFASNEQNVVSGSVCQGQSQGGRARADLIIIVEAPPSVPICRPIPPSPLPAAAGQFWALDASRSFSPGDGAQKLEYALRSLPRGSGLTIDPRSGVISGVLTPQDALSSPLTLVVAVTNGYGTCQSNVVVTVGSRPLSPSPMPAPQICPVNPQNIFIQNANEGEFFTLDLTKYFVAQRGDARLTFQSSGLPPGTGFNQDPYTGLFTGSPSNSDVNQGTLMILTTVSCPFGQSVTKQWQLVVSRGRGCNACKFNNGGCQHLCTVQNPQSCTPTCGCNPGFLLNSDGQTCRAGTPCDRNNGGCSSVCSGQGMCSCAPNWLLTPDKRTCGYDACGYNNGGCEQLCTAAGQQARCDCRVGTLNPDGRTCSSQIITVGTIPPGLVIGCQTFVFDFATAFRHAGGQRLTFTTNGLPAGTGFRIDSNGLMSGTPTAADCASPQPMTVGVTASYGDASVHAVMFMSAFCTPSVCPGTSPTPAIAGPGTSIPLLSAMVCVDFHFDVSPYFTGGEGRVQFAVLGLPAGSGFQMTTDGVLNGMPNERDCAMSPLSLTVIARDSRGRESKSLVTIRFASCACQQRWQPPPYQPPALPPAYQPPAYQPPALSTGSITLPPQQITIPGSQITIPASQITIPSSQVLVPGQQFTISATTIPATTTPATPIVSPPVISPPVVISPPRPPVTLSSPECGCDGSLHIHNTAQCGQPFFIDTAEYFRVNGLRFSVRGLPVNSGLRLSDSGILSGTPNLADARAVNPLYVTVTATDRLGVSVDLTVEIEVQGDCGRLTPPAYDVQYRSGFAQPPADENTGILPVQMARRGEYFRLDLSRISFSGLPGTLQYSAAGLPVRSGLTLSKAGLLSGIPNDVDCSQAQPMQLTVHVSGAEPEKAAKGIVTIKVVCGNESLTSLLPVSGALPMASGVVGDLFYYDTAVYLMDTSAPVSFESSGIVTGSNLKISSAGILSGILSNVDVNGPPLLIRVKDQKGYIAQRTLRLNIRTKMSNNSAPVFVPLEVASAPIGRPFSLNVAQRFYDKDNDALHFSMSELAQESGLKFDNISGVLSGVPVAFDAQQPQPVKLVAFAEDGKGSKTEGPIFVSFTDPSQSSSKASKPVAISTGVNRDPVAISIKRQVGTQGIPFLMGVASSFVDQDGDLLSYRLEGLPYGTGLSIDASGLISGTPTQADADALQPLVLTVSVSDGQGGTASQMFLLTILHGQKSANHDPVAQTIPEAQGFVGEPFILRASFNFADPDGDFLTYSMAGAPANSGLVLDSASGVLSGTPTNADLAASPLTLTVVVDDGMGGVAKSFLKLTISPQRQRQNRKPETRAMPQLSSDGNSRVNFAVSEYFADPDGDSLRYEVFGLPKDTGLSLTKGILSGVPSTSDLEAKQPLVAGLVACDTNNGCTGNILYITLRTSAHPTGIILGPDFVKGTPVTRGGVPKIEFEMGLWGFFQTSRFFPSSGQITSYQVGGLPNNTGFVFDPSTGVLVGTPNLADIMAQDACVGQCIPIVVTATQGTGALVAQPLLLKISTRGDNVNHVPFARSIPQSHSEPGKMFLLDVWTSFVDSDGDELQFSVTGLPESSGFSIVESSGVFFGIPSEADLKASPLVLTVVVNDQRGGKAQESFTLTISKSMVQTKSCQQLGWPVVAGTSVCSRSKLGAECAIPMSFDQAQSMCVSLGARLCSTQELAESRSTDGECGTRVWTSSVCAFDGEVITQAAPGKSSSALPKQCTIKTDLANVQCCANTDDSSKALAPTPLSRKTCDQLTGFITSPSSPNKAVCTTAAVLQGKAQQCSGAVTFAKATELCAKRMARLCTADELSQDVGNDQICNYNDKRVWTSSECGEGQVITQAGASAFLRTLPKQCTKTSEQLPVYCCADQKPDQYFQNLDVSSTKTTIKFTWDWRVYPKGQISFRKANADKALTTWTTPNNGHEVPMGGPASFQLTGLQSNVRYLVRIMPMTADGKLVKTQAVEFRVTTLE